MSKSASYLRRSPHDSLTDIPIDQLSPVSDPPEASAASTIIKEQAALIVTACCSTACLTICSNCQR
jgi:hypothetical protein